MKIADLRLISVKVTKSGLKLLTNPLILVVLIPILIICLSLLYLFTSPKNIFSQMLISSAGLTGYHSEIFSANVNESLVKINLENQIVTISFKWSSDQKAKAEQMSDKIGLGKDWINGINFKIDQPTAVKLWEYLPLTTYISLDSDRIFLGDQINSQLVKPISEDQQSSSGGKLSVINLPDNSLSIDINDPDIALTQAVNNGNLSLSDQLTDNGFWQLIAKFDKINLSFKDHSLIGEIVFRSN